MEKIVRLKRIFKREKIDGYIIPKNDEFFGEYTPRYNDRLKYISNFTGSYGYALILRSTNYLFVDGRYTLQANNQSGKNFKVVTFPNQMPYNFIKNKKLTIGFDPKLFTKKSLEVFFGKNFKNKPIENNLVDEIWKRNVKVINEKFYNMPEESINESYNSKANKIVLNLRKKRADYQFITASENNAWMLNIRGRDTEFTPIPHCYVLVDKFKKINFFCDLKKISYLFKKNLKNINFININLVNDYLLKIKKKKFIIDSATCSLYFENIILKNNKILNIRDPLYFLKAIKSKKEIDNIKKIHIDDGVALTKYLFWIKKNFKKKMITEISASKKLLKFRKMNKKFRFSSFPTISGTGSNGAIIHYKATKKTNKKLKRGDVYLVDSGGQYKFGTTDVTRTISLDNFNRRIKEIFTRVLKGHIAVADFKFKKDTVGSNIDKEARKYLKQIGLNYAHGTGHGVGYFLNVHEGPHAISKNNRVKLQTGMIVSNEPGYYEKGNFGIRIENLIYIKNEKKQKVFQNLTMVPIEKDLIDKSILNKNEKNWLNNYHKEVYQKISRSMTGYEILELKKACSAI